MGNNGPHLKMEGGYQVLGAVEVEWKVCTAVINCCLKQSVVFHNSMHGFREGRGMETATLKANLAQQLSGLAHETLFQVFLDICKAFDSLDRGRCLEVLRSYWLSPNLSCLLTGY